MLANPQRDITAEWAAEKLRSLSTEHYKEAKEIDDFVPQQLVYLLPNSERSKQTACSWWEI